MIEIHGLTKRFTAPPRPGRTARVVEALRDVSLMIPAGAVWAVVGPNAAGKSTLFALLLGFLRPSAGEVRIEGMAPRDYVRARGAGYLPERFQVAGEWRVRATLRALAALDGWPRAEAHRRADAVLERFALGEHAERPVRDLSRGLVQRLGLAQALLAPRELIVLDEPTEGLDPLWRIRFRALVEELRREGRTVLMASHDLGEVERLAGEAVLLDAGRVRRVLRLEDAAAGPTQRYRLELAEPSAALLEAFPGAEPAADRGAPAYLVQVSDAGELSRRLAALLAAGAVLVAVHPVHEPLEERVRRALAEGGDE
ncbi:MAG: ABC transporter ATP-binding protein [Gemmatimonadetes bacterium]|nr:ABC transporter ATP-binding protein [Gemmatimonadota bacterium]